MNEFTHNIEIASSAKDVFETVTDHNKLDHWLHGIKDFRFLDGHQIEEGSVFAVTVEAGGMEIELKQTVISFDPYSQYGLQIENNMVQGQSLMRIVEEDGATVLHTSLKVTGKGFYKMMIPMFFEKLRERQVRDLEKLKKLLEENEIK